MSDHSVVVPNLDMLQRVMAVARAYASLGDAVTSQIDDAIERGLPNVVVYDEAGPGSVITAGAARYVADRLLEPLRDLADEVENAGREELTEAVAAFTTFIKEAR